MERRVDWRCHHANDLRSMQYNEQHRLFSQHKHQQLRRSKAVRLEGISGSR
jgi:hypothetical protein